jgi:thiol-disulfide isomerase/thioredoxin
MTRWQAWIGALVLLLLLSGFLLWRWAPREEGGTARQAIPEGMLRERAGGASVTTEVNAKAPALAAVALDGATVRSIDQIGRRVLLLSFWSVFCTSCIQEMPFLARLNRTYGPQGLEVVGVNTDFFAASRISKFLARLEPPPPYRIVHDQSQEISRAFNVEALPVTVLVDSAGWIRMVHLGYKREDEAEIEAAVRKWLGRIRESTETVGAVGGKTAVVPAAAAAIQPGSPLPDLAAPDTEGTLVEVAAWRGDGPLVLFFWSLFCAPCREEMPHLVELAREESGGGRWLSVNLDAAPLAPRVGAFVRASRLPFPTLLDALAPAGRSLAQGLHVTHTPTLVIADREGIVREVLVGHASGEEADRALTRAIRATVGGGGRGEAGPPP